jgi:DNA-binding transcriptional LysR family regulator
MAVFASQPVQSCKDVNWDDLRVFLAVARAGRVAAAARQLDVEHSTVSRRLAGLEASLGAPLFHRTAGGYRLTAVGEITLLAAEQMERGVLGLGSKIAERVGRLSGRVRIALLDELASHWLALRLPELRAALPDIELQIVTGILPLDLSRGEAELAIRTPRPRQRGLSAVRLARVSTGLYASRSWLGKRKVTIDSGTSGLDLLVYLPAYQLLQGADWFQPVLSRSRVVLATNSTHSLLAATRAGAGVGVLARFMAVQYPDLVAISEDLSAGDMWLVTHPEFRRDPKVRAVAAQLRILATTLV